MVDAKYHIFSVKFDRNLNSSECRRLEKILYELDTDAPVENEIFPEGFNNFCWRRGPTEKDFVEAISILKVDFKYQYVHYGRDHNKNGEENSCTICGETDTYRYGGICEPEIKESDWKNVKVK